MKFCINHKDRRVFSKGLCAQCYKIKYSKPLRRSPIKKKPFFIKPIADKRAKQLKLYSLLKKQFLVDHPICQIKGLHCQTIATEIHHSGGRENELLLDISKFKASCHNCHHEITENSKKAVEEGNSISRISKNSTR